VAAAERLFWDALGESYPAPLLPGAEDGDGSTEQKPDDERLFQDIMKRTLK
jgi:hypothetical protein